MKYLDCGCAFTDEGKRVWCPSCSVESPRPKPPAPRLTQEQREALEIAAEACPHAAIFNEHGPYKNHDSLQYMQAAATIRKMLDEGK